MSITNRTISLPGIWADDAQTNIPTPPIANTTYRNTDLTQELFEDGWAFQKIVNSADFNQSLWLLSGLMRQCEQYGILPWCSTTPYLTGGLCLGTNGVFYVAKQDNTGQNPVNDASNTYWDVFVNPEDNFVTETQLNTGLNLKENVGNKTQVLNASSTTDQYPSAKATYDNLNLKLNSSAVAQNLTNPSANTVPSTTAVSNESSRIIDIMNTTDAQNVKLTGNQTVNGIKTFTGDNVHTGINYCQRNGDTRWVCKHIGIQQGTAPSSNQYGGVRFLDKNNVELGSIYGSYRTDGSTRTCLWVKSPVEGSKATSEISINYDANGNVFTACPSPELSSNNANIATTAWFNQKIQVVSALPASPNANVFYFVKES